MWELLSSLETFLKWLQEKKESLSTSGLYYVIGQYSQTNPFSLSVPSFPSELFFRGQIENGNMSGKSPSCDGMLLHESLERAFRFPPHSISSLALAS